MECEACGLPMQEAPVTDAADDRAFCLRLISAVQAVHGHIYLADTDSPSVVWYHWPTLQQFRTRNLGILVRRYKLSDDVEH